MFCFDPHFLHSEKSVDLAELQFLLAGNTSKTGKLPAAHQMKLVPLPTLEKRHFSHQTDISRQKLYFFFNLGGYTYKVSVFTSVAD
jgi:hypothetical protein